MLNKVMLMSEYDAKQTKAVRNDSIERMNFSLAGTLCLVALLMAAIWASILYLGSRLLGVPMEIGILLRISVGIFLISLFGLGLAVSAGNASEKDNGNHGDQS